MLRTVLLVMALVLLVAAAGVAVVGGSIRSAGEERLAAVLEAHAAAGYGSTFADLAATAPPVDRERQARLWAWMKGNVPVLKPYSADRDLGWRLQPGAEAPQDALEVHEAFRAEVEALEALYAEGDLCLTSLGWLPEDLAGTTMRDRVGGHIPNLLRMREITKWYAVEAALADDPTHALARLERLRADTARAGSLIDALIAIACDAMRDRAMAVLALSGRCPTDRLEAWFAEGSRSAQLVADGLRAERLRFGAPLGQDLARGRTVRDHFGSALEQEGLLDSVDLWEHNVRPWFHAASECAVHLEGMVALERHVRGEIGRQELDAHLAACSGLGYPFTLATPNPNGTLVSAAANADRHRFVRAAVAIALEARDRGALPVDVEEARAWLTTRRSHLVAQSGQTHLLYDRPTPTRFRVAMDFYDKPDVLRRKQPVAERPLVLAHDFIEIHVPAKR